MQLKAKIKLCNLFIYMLLKNNILIEKEFTSFVTNVYVIVFEI